MCAAAARSSDKAGPRIRSNDLSLLCVLLPPETTCSISLERLCVCVWVRPLQAPISDLDDGDGADDPAAARRARRLIAHLSQILRLITFQRPIAQPLDRATCCLVLPKRDERKHLRPADSQLKRRAPVTAAASRASAAIRSAAIRSPRGRRNPNGARRGLEIGLEVVGAELAYQSASCRLVRCEWPINKATGCCLWEAPDALMKSLGVSPLFVFILCPLSRAE